jgi:ketosteroid isomerase-like protein
MKKLAVDIVREFWALMQTNDFRSVGQLLSDDYVLEWPQSNERVRGRDNFAAMNEQYPAHGRWQFVINNLVGNDTEAVSDVSVQQLKTTKSVNRLSFGQRTIRLLKIGGIL